jgi:cyclophilin family peptidyl-prolyl cis-trans isomerase
LGGTGAGGESIYGREFEDELDTNTPSYKEGYMKGVVAMANAGPNTNSSQFFVMLTDYPQMPKAYSIFGKVDSALNQFNSILTSINNLLSNLNGSISISLPGINCANLAGLAASCTTKAATSYAYTPKNQQTAITNINQAVSQISSQDSNRYNQFLAQYQQAVNNQQNNQTYSGLLNSTLA